MCAISVPREYAKEKLSAVTPIVGYKEDGWLTEEFMQRVYAGLEVIDVNRSYFMI